MENKKKFHLDLSKKSIKAGLVILVLLILGSLVSGIMGAKELHSAPGSLTYQNTLEMERQRDLEDYDEDNTVCDVTFTAGDDKMIKSYSYAEYEDLDVDSITAYEYETEKGTKLFFDHKDPSQDEIADAYTLVMAEKTMPLFNACSSLAILSVSLLVMLVWGQFFTTYEKSWFLSIMTLATIVSVAFPEESANGVNGIVVMLLYLLDTFLNILCELLISKQSKYNFLVSVAVEITEIVMCIVLMYRFATMVTTLFFWLPIDILSYINWSRHQDDEDDDLTMVRRLG